MKILAWAAAARLVVLLPCFVAGVALTRRLETVPRATAPSDPEALAGAVESFMAATPR